MATETPTVRIVRDRAFAERLNKACDHHPHVPPYNYGRLTWIRDHLNSDRGLVVTLETVRKWFSGESRPRVSKMAYHAGGVRGIYNAAEYLDGRRQMMQWWADYLDRLVESCK